MKQFIRLIRPKEWIKNLFLFIPYFFAGKRPELGPILSLFLGVFTFSITASGIYVLNDLRDIESDKLHPIKQFRPLAAGTFSKEWAILIIILFWTLGLGLSWFIFSKFCFILFVYLILNIGYSFGLKNISILDIFIVASGFVLRSKAGGAISGIYVSTWLNIMIFLLSLIMVTAKRRDDILIKIKSGLEIRKSVKGYNLDFLNTLLGLISGITIMAYLMYTISPNVIAQHNKNSFRLYYSCIFVLAGILRYLQIALVESDSGSPTGILYRDRFIQVCIFLWILSFYFILYVPVITFF